MKRRTMNNTRHKQGGFSMISAIVLLMIASMFGLALAGLSINSGRMADHRKDRTIAFGYAEAGLYHAIAELRDDESYEGQGKTEFGDGWFEIEVSLIAGQPKYRRIVSEGAVGQIVVVSGEPTRIVEAIVDVSGQHQGIEYALFADLHMEFSGNAVIRRTPCSKIRV